MDTYELNIKEAIDTINQYYLTHNTENQPELIYDYNLDGTLLESPEAFWPHFITQTAQILREGYEDIQITIDNHKIVKHPTLSSICASELQNYLGINIDPQNYSSLESIRLSKLRGYLGVNIHSLENYLEVKHHPKFHKKYIEFISKNDPKTSFAKVKAEIIGRLILNKSIDTINHYYLKHDPESISKQIYEYKLNGSQLLRSPETFWPQFISGAAQIIQDGYDDIRISMEGHNIVEHPSLASVCLSELEKYLQVNINCFDTYLSIKDHPQFYSNYMKDVFKFDPQSIFTTIKAVVIGRTILEKAPISQEWSICLEKLVSKSSILKKLYKTIKSSHGLFYGMIKLELIKKEGDISACNLGSLYNDYTSAFRLILDYWESGDSDFSITLCQNIRLIYPIYFYAILLQCQDLKYQIKKYIRQTSLFMISDPLFFFKKEQLQLTQKIDVKKTIDNFLNIVHTEHEVSTAIHQILTSDIEESLYPNISNVNITIDVQSERKKIIHILSESGIDFIPSSMSIQHLEGLRFLSFQNINFSNTDLHLYSNSIKTLHLINGATDPNLDTNETSIELNLEKMGNLRSLYLIDIFVDNLALILSPETKLNRIHLSNCSKVPLFFCENENNELSPYTPNLKFLSLRSMRTDHVAIMLNQYNQLKHITLSKLIDISVEPTINSQIIEFNLSSNTTFNRISLDELILENIQFIIKKNTKLDRLTLKNCSCTPRFFYHDNEFKKNIHYTPSIKKLIYSQMPLLDLEIYSATQPNLEDLVINDCQPNSMEYTSNNPYEVHLKNLINLKRLTLKNMNLTNIKLLLAENLVIQELTLSDCDVFDLSFLNSSLASLIIVEYKDKNQILALRQFFENKKNSFQSVNYKMIE